MSDPSIEASQFAVLPGPFCLPMSGMWRAENGYTLTLRSHHGEALLSTLCRRFGIPEGVPMPYAVHALLSAACESNVTYEHRLEIMALARSMLERAQEQVARQGNVG